MAAGLLSAASNTFRDGLLPLERAKKEKWIGISPGCHHGFLFIMTTQSSMPPSSGVPVPALSPKSGIFHEVVDTVSFNDTVSFMPQEDVAESALRESYQNKVDNSLLNYVAITLRCGVVAMCRTNVLTTCPSVLQDLNRDLSQCLEFLPWSVHSFIRRTRIWVNITYSYGPKNNPTFLSHSTAHHHEAWLIW